MDSKEFRYYYNEKETEPKNNFPLCSILLKNIFTQSFLLVSKPFVF